MPKGNPNPKQHLNSNYIQVSHFLMWNKTTQWYNRRCGTDQTSWESNKSWEHLYWNDDSEIKIL